MTLPVWAGPLAYLAVFVATIVEGEVVFVAAAVLVHQGQLRGAGVFLAAALGGSAGDQIYFYALRSRLAGWLQRFPAWIRRRDRIVGRVRRNATSLILACRFLPGLRVAIPAACAAAGVSPARFSSLSLVSSLFWAASVMLAVAWVGPASLHRLGVPGWWAPLLAGGLVLAFSWWLAHAATEPEHALHADGEACPRRTGLEYGTLSLDAELVSDYMTRDVVTLREADTLRSAVELVLLRRVRHVPILDAGRRLVGIVTDRDVKRMLPSPLSVPPPDQYEALLDETPVGRAMTKEPVTIMSDAPLADAVQLMLDKRVGGLPVIEGDQLVGMLTQSDALRAFLKRLKPRAGA